MQNSGTRGRKVSFDLQLFLPENFVLLQWVGILGMSKLRLILQTLQIGITLENSEAKYDYPLPTKTE